MCLKLRQAFSSSLSSFSQISLHAQLLLKITFAQVITVAQNENGEDNMKIPLEKHASSFVNISVLLRNDILSCPLNSRLLSFLSCLSWKVPIVPEDRWICGFLWLVQIRQYVICNVTVVILMPFKDLTPNSQSVCVKVWFYLQLQKEREKILEYKRQVQNLVNKSKKIVQLKPRNPDYRSSKPIILRALCDYKQDQVCTRVCRAKQKRSLPLPIDFCPSREQSLVQVPASERRS